MPKIPDQRAADRVERQVQRLLAGRSLRLDARDSEEREAIMAASLLAGSRQAFPRPSATFRQRLATRLVTMPAASLSRRSALLASVGLAVGGTIGAGLARLLPTQESARSQQTEIVPTSGRWTDVGALTDLPEREGVMVTAGSVIAYLFRSGDQVRAVSGVCSHLPCVLEWRPRAADLYCPCHGQNFDSSGRSLSSEYPLPPLTRVRARIVDGRVEVLGT